MNDTNGRTRRRPNGLIPLIAGILLVIAGAVLYIVAGQVETSSRFIPNALSNWRLVVVAVSLFLAGIFMLMTAAIVRAIWFLPGEDRQHRS